MEKESRPYIRMTTLLTDEINEKLESYCYGTGVPKSVLVRKLLVEFFEKQKKKGEQYMSDFELLKALQNELVETLEKRINRLKTALGGLYFY